MRRFFRVPRDRMDPATGEPLSYRPMVAVELFFLLMTAGGVLVTASDQGARAGVAAGAAALLGYLFGIALAWSLFRFAQRRIDRAIRPKSWEYALDAAGPWLIPVAGPAAMYAGGLTENAAWHALALVAAGGCLAGFIRAFMFLEVPAPRKSVGG